jgi:hypothetical protein|tara:strand:- start:138 stop:383 length:246 start_codon:yes stop_codon:yes gene_type:complete
VKKKTPCLDLHGVLHDEADHIIEKFITDNFQRFPIIIITGYSSFFIKKMREYTEKYELGYYPSRQGAAHSNYGCWIIFENK